MKYNCEKLSETLPELKPLFIKHWQEIAHYKDIPLNPDYDKYLKMEEWGVLKLYTVRDDSNELIGYAAFIISFHPHYKESLQAIEDIIFIRQDRRGIGKIFISWCDEQLKLLNVQEVVHHVKFAHDWSQVLIKMGYEKTEMRLSKRLDK